MFIIGADGHVKPSVEAVEAELEKLEDRGGWRFSF